MYVRSESVIKGAVILLAISFGAFTTSLFSDRGGVISETRAADAQRSGAAVYAQVCTRCHGEDGRAKTAKGKSLGATDLTSTDWMPDTARDIRIVTRGKENMPTFRGKLKPAEIEAVVAYIRRFKQ